MDPKAQKKSWLDFPKSLLHLSKGSHSYLVSSNKYILLGVTLILAQLTGPAYINWAPLRKCLYRAGAYSWLCDLPGMDGVFDISKVETGDSALCTAQFLAVNKIISLTTYCHFFFSFFAGFLLDFVGPKLTGMLGCTLVSCGWIIIALSSYSRPMYIPGFVVMSLGLEASFLPILCVAKLFPKRQAFILSLLGGCRSLCLFFPPLFHMIILFSHKPAFNTFRYIIIVYVFAGLGSCLALFGLFIPLNKWEIFFKHSIIDYPQISSTNTNKDKDASYSDPSNLTTNFCSETYNEASSFSVKLSTMKFVRKHIISPEFRVFLNEICSLKFILLSLHAMIFVLRDTYFSASSEKLVPDALNLFTICAILSFLPAPLFGLLADKIGIIWVMQLLNYAAFQMFIFTTLPAIPTFVGLQYASVLTYSIVISFVLSQVYCYGVLFFPTQHIGKLIGIIVSLGGLASIMAHPLLALSVKLNDFFPVNLGILIVSILNGISLFVLYKISNKPSKTPSIK